jgi:sec-independent protein translocase protein TatA
MGEFSITHWLIILVILLLFFGPSKLPGLGSSLGKAIRGFKSGLNEADPNEHTAQQSRPDQIQSSDKNAETTKNKDHNKA